MLLVTLNSKPSSRLWEKVKLKFLDLQFILSCIQLIYCSVIFKCKIIAKISFCYIEVFYFRYSTSSLNECKIIVSIKNKLKFNNKEKNLDTYFSKKLRSSAVINWTKKEINKIFQALLIFGDVPNSQNFKNQVKPKPNYVISLVFQTVFIFKIIKLKLFTKQYMFTYSKF